MCSRNPLLCYNTFSFKTLFEMNPEVTKRMMYKKANGYITSVKFFKAD